MKYLVFDTETTGLVQWGASPIDPRHCKLVQLGCILFDTNHYEIATLKTIVIPLAPIGAKAEETHGISMEVAKEYGVSNENALEIFCDFVDIADVVVAHNMSFDALVMRHAAHNAKMKGDIFEGKELRCTKEATTSILRLPKPNGKKGYKWPSLQECMTYFFKEDIQGAHDAMVDVRACARVYQSLTKNFEPRELKWQ
jgi:DNA polymerase III epsilon subunit-like protein